MFFDYTLLKPHYAFIRKELKTKEFVRCEDVLFERFKQEEIKKAKKGETDLSRTYSYLIKRNDYVLCYLDGDLQIKRVKAVNQTNYLLKIQVDTRKWIGKTKIIAKVI